MDYSERNFEETIEQQLAERGYLIRAPEQYDRDLCLDPEIALSFIQATQPREWDKLRQQYGADTRERFLARLRSEIERRGTLDVLRNGVKDVGAKFQLAYFVPSSGLNPELQRQYEANNFSVVRQLKYQREGNHKLDLTLFLNGLPLFTAELKNHFTGQDIQHAIRQYKFDRDEREPFFQLGRCLAHFAVDNDLAFVTTHLRGKNTLFLPFNLGKYGGAGNPPRLDTFATAYLWEEIWTPDSALNLIQHFIHEVEDEYEDARGRTRKRQQLIFPRYHQLDAVRRLVADARANGTGQRYLIQHSAGSGKSNSIAWLAHQLSVLHDDQDRRVFDSIIVISDRRVIDRQLQDVVRQFEQTLGVVETIGPGKTSQDLKDALEKGKTIIVSTLQKFPMIVDEIHELAGSRFAVIIDEAHSSQSGESVKGLKAALAVDDLEEAEAVEPQELETYEDLISEEMEKRRWSPNVSVFAFTATPKAKTLELFGTRQRDGSFEPFSLYSMRQAIEEGFILDVLENHTTYRTYWSLLKTIEDDPRYDRDKAIYLLRKFVDLHPHAIEQKVAIMIEHFVDNVAEQINGQAKAMIVTRSRLHCVRYKLAVDRYLKAQGLSFKALVAFTGTVHDKGLDYTEANMNGFPDSQTAEVFKQDVYRILIVANKFQTGFDQPLLHTMYVDKKLAGVHAVQTLSRLNRTYPPYKDSTMVLDFANTAEEILAAFEPYYEKTLLAESSDPNLLYDMQNELAAFHFYTEAEVDQFARIYYDPKGTQAQLHGVLEPIVGWYIAAPLDYQDDFRSQLSNYIRLYAFLSQVITFTDPDLERLYVFARLLKRKLPVTREELPIEIQKNIEIDFYRVQQTHSGHIQLPRGQTELSSRQPMARGGHVLDEEEALSQIIQTLNDRFGTDFTEEDKVFIREFEERLVTNPTLENSVRVNTRENARLTFEHVANDTLQDMIDTNFKFYKRANDDMEFARLLFDWLFERIARKLEGAA
jgi:type I restriction enzyme R subunit